MQVGMYDKSIEFKKYYNLHDLSWACCQFTLLQGFSCLVVAPFPNGTVHHQYVQFPAHPTTRNISTLLLCLPSSICHCRCVGACQTFDLALLAILHSQELIHLSPICIVWIQRLTVHFANRKSISPLRSACRRGCSFRERRTTLAVIARYRL